MLSYAVITILSGFSAGLSSVCNAFSKSLSLNLCVIKPFTSTSFLAMSCTAIGYFTGEIYVVKKQASSASSKFILPLNSPANLRLWNLFEPYVFGILINSSFQKTTTPSDYDGCGHIDFACSFDCFMKWRGCSSSSKRASILLTCGKLNNPTANYANGDVYEFGRIYEGETLAHPR